MLKSQSMVINAAVNIAGLAADRVSFYCILSLVFKLSVDQNIPLCSANNSEYSGILQSADGSYVDAEQVISSASFTSAKSKLTW